MTQAIAQTRPRQTAKFAKIYAGAWTLLAALALAYMVTLAVQPSVLGNLARNRLETETAEGQSTAARFATDISGLKQSVGEVQKDVAALRTTVVATVSREKDIIERLTAVEERTKAPLVADVVAPKTAAQKQAELRAQKAAERAAAAQAAAAAKTAPPTAPPAAAETSVAAAEPAPAAARVTVLNAPSTNPIATGSIAVPPAQGVPAPPPATAAPITAPIAFGPGAVTATAPAAPAAVELATGPSLDALRLNWSLLAERHGGSLKNLEARYTNAGEGQPYQLMAGPLASPEEAAKVCAQLKAKKVACRVTGFGGNAL